MDIEYRELLRCPPAGQSVRHVSRSHWQINRHRTREYKEGQLGAAMRRTDSPPADKLAFSLIIYLEYEGICWRDVLEHVSLHILHLLVLLQSIDHMGQVEYSAFHVGERLSDREGHRARRPRHLHQGPHPSEQLAAVLDNRFRNRNSIAPQAFLHQPAEPGNGPRRLPDEHLVRHLEGRRRLLAPEPRASQLPRPQQRLVEGHLDERSNGSSHLVYKWE
ncbi:trans-resveratrol di-O-methyltransferase-like isoform X2 [Iris pallida]|uniref:Trans-resveratrol di-O-methyltransferase-like isoform X2 n=1 Tax=Iris pallida TaxID=29817 RepID=A0AAX6H6N7_IRIPA|nr:trans-resveratrol di-O-methyltransferase-like isoform X2 [Iris pallida]